MRRTNRKASGKASPNRVRRQLRTAFRTFANRLFGKGENELISSETAIVLDETLTTMKKIRPELDESQRNEIFHRIFAKEYRRITNVLH